MSKKSTTEIKLHGVKIVNPKTIDMSQALSIVIMKLNLQIEKRIEWINTKARTIILNRFKYGKEFRKNIGKQIKEYESDIEYLKTQLLLLGKPYGQN